MRINEILEQQGWELVERQGWTAVQDHRPEFRAAFTTNLVGKIVDMNFYVMLPQPDVAKDLIRQPGGEAVSITSKNCSRDATYWRFDTKDVSEDDVRAFATRLAYTVNQLI